MIIAHTKISGEIRAILYNRDGSVAYDSGWFPNLLTNQGLDNMDESAWASNWNVGSSSQAPAFTDTSLFGWMAQGFSSGVISTVGTAPNWEFSTTNVRRYEAGVATGTLREIGMNSHLYPTNTKLSIRALFSPEINKAADQVLDIYYKLTRWPDIVDRTGVVNIKGENYNYIVRGANYGNGSTTPGNFSFVNAFGNLGVNASTTTSTVRNGELAAINSEPTTSISSPWSTSIAKTASGSGFADFRIKWGLDNGNSTNIRCIMLREEGHGTSNNRGWQIRLGKVSDDSPLTKLNTEELWVDFRVTWARYP